MNKQFFLPGIILLFAFGCTEPIDLKFGGSDDRILVVDGYLTDSLKRHEIRLSYTTGFNNRGVFVPAPIDNARIILIDDNDNTINLTFSGFGKYLTPEMKAIEGTAYRIEVQVNEEVFESDFYSLPEGTGDIELSYEPETRSELSSRGIVRETRGVRVEGSLTNVTPNSYFRWEIEHHFIGEAFVINDYCFVRDFDPQRVDVLEAPTNVSPEHTLSFELGFIEPSYKFKHDYAVVARQLIIDRASFLYWKRVREQITNVGSLFDSAPARINGNVRNRRTGVQVLGYFGVYKESVGRTFFNQKELPYEVIDYECAGGAVAEFCIDCLKHPGAETVTLPSPERYWWRCLIFFDNEDSRGTLTKPAELCD